MLRAVHRLTTRFDRTIRCICIAAGTAAILGFSAPAVASDAVMEWNDIARGMVVVPALSPVQQTRHMAIVQVAVHDAVNGVTGRYQQYRRTGAAPAGATAEAAAIGAAYAVLRGLFSDANSLSTLAMKYALSLDSQGVSPQDPGLAFGEGVAAGILALRANDGSAQAAFSYLPADAGAPGVWVPISSAPAAQAQLPGWGHVAPWVLRSTSQFRPDGPPALDGERYAKDYNEILYVGQDTSSTRTDEQKQIALFWRASPTALWNPVLRTAIESRGLDLSATARVMALFYLAAADASVACWEAKYVYNFWRPEPAIVRADEDGNVLTAANPAWKPLVPTPNHPEYPSAHSFNSSAMGFVLKSIFGDAPGYVIDATSSTNPGFVRHWQTFSQGVDEVVDARVYSGIHFRNSDEVGARLGRQVAKFVLTHALKPVK